MKPVKYFFKITPVEVEINLCSAYVAVSEHFLHCTNIGAALEKVSGKSMSQRVRVYFLLYSRCAGIFPQHPPDGNARKFRPAEIQEQQVAGNFSRSGDGSGLIIFVDPMQRYLTDGDYSFLGSLAEDSYDIFGLN